MGHIAHSFKLMIVDLEDNSKQSPVFVIMEDHQAWPPALNYQTPTPEEM